jgi:hypothetical protein
VLISKRRRPLLAIPAAIVAVLSVGLAPAVAGANVAGQTTPTVAESWSGPCYDGLANSWRIALPGKTDLDVNTQPCVYKSGNQLYASIIIDWIEDQAPPVGSGHKFDGFLLRVNFEVRPNGGSTDTIFLHADFDLTTVMNANWSGRRTYQTTVYTGYSSSFEYSSDGWAQYDVDNDGKSWLTPRQFVGSPFIH